MKNGISTLTIRRVGVFQVETMGSHHCGTGRFLEIDYALEVVCTPNELDERGFLFDQLKVQQFFDAVQITHLSCEKLAMKLAERIFTRIQQENKKCNPRKVTLSISPYPNAAVLTYEWTADAILRCLTKVKPKAKSSMAKVLLPEVTA